MSERRATTIVLALSLALAIAASGCAGEASSVGAGRPGVDVTVGPEAETPSSTAAAPQGTGPGPSRGSTSTTDRIATATPSTTAAPPTSPPTTTGKLPPKKRGWQGIWSGETTRSDKLPAAPSAPVVAVTASSEPQVPGTVQLQWTSTSPDPLDVVVRFPADGVTTVVPSRGTCKAEKLEVVCRVDGLTSGAPVTLVMKGPSAGTKGTTLVVEAVDKSGTEYTGSLTMPPLI
ncbi:MAG: hypothetical protein ACRD12_23300 [Acidimicrobiales bacterium]